MEYAIIENGVVINVISLDATNAAEFPGAVQIDNVPAVIGDVYENGQFASVDGSDLMLRLDSSEETLAEQDALYIDALYQDILEELGV